MLIFIMFTYNRIAVLIGALEKVSDCVSDVTRITRVTLEFIDNALLVGNCRFRFGYSEFLGQFLASRNRLDGVVDFTGQELAIELITK